MTFSKTKIRNKASDAPVKGSVSESFAYASDGTRLYVRERTILSHGDGLNASEGGGVQEFPAPSDFTVILCDGICCDGYIWKYLWDDLAPVAKLCHWNYRGHGRSAPPNDPDQIGIPAHADDLDRVRRHVGDGPVVLIGHSMGCQVVLEAYRQRPEKIRGL